VRRDAGSVQQQQLFLTGLENKAMSLLNARSAEHRRAGGHRLLEQRGGRTPGDHRKGGAKTLTESYKKLSSIGDARLGNAMPFEGERTGSAPR
jgi:hypothetical protein